MDRDRFCLDAYAVTLAVAFALALSVLAGVCGAVEPSDFTYLGRVNVPNAGMSVRGLAMRPDTGTCFTISKGGQDKFELLEIAMPADVSAITAKTTLVRNHGTLNPANELAISGQQLVSMRGLLWDVRRGGLWVSYGSFYANGVNNAFLAFYRFNADNSRTLFGPWKVAASVHSDTVKGCLIDAPEPVEWATGRRFLAFGSRGSTAQNQSWGTGLVSLERPELTRPAFADLAAEKRVHYPQQTIAPNVAASDFPRDPSDPPAAWIVNGVATPLPTYGQADAVHSVAQVDDSLLWFGYAAQGGAWYGGPNANASRPSMLDPEKPMIGISPAHGLQAEAYRAKFWLTSVESVVEAIRSGNQQLGFDYVGNVATLGGSVNLQSAEMSQPVFDRETRRLYVPNLGTGAQGAPFIHVWSVAP